MDALNEVKQLNKVEGSSRDSFESESSGVFSPSVERGFPEVSVEDFKNKQERDVVHTEDSDDRKVVEEPSPYISLGYPIYPTRAYSSNSSIKSSNAWIDLVLKKIVAQGTYRW